MSTKDALVQVLATHYGQWTWGGPAADPVTCACGWTGCIADHPSHVAAAILATPCPVCGGAGIVDTSPPGVETAPWLATDIDCPACAEEKP